MERGSYVNTYRSKKTSVYFKGERIRHVITHNLSSAKPGEILHVEVPRLQNTLIVPGSLALSFDMDITPDLDDSGNPKSVFLVNNLAANIVSRYVVKIGSEIVFDLNYAHLYNSYKDMWLSQRVRKNSVFKGIQSTYLRKTRTNITITDVAPDTISQTLKDIFKNRYILKLDFDLISDHMPLSSALNIIFELTISNKDDVLNYLSETTTDFTMNNIRLEYETIENDELLQKENNSLAFGTSYLFDHVQHFKREIVKKNDDRIFAEVNGIDRRSMKGILLIFQDDFDAGKRNSDRFINPRIEDINLTIDSIPNKLYSCGYKEENQWNEICKHFMQEDYKHNENTFVDIKSYNGGGKFALWIDLRSTEDNTLHRSGKVQKSANKIMLEMKKKQQEGNGRYFMHIYSTAHVISPCQAS